MAKKASIRSRKHAPSALLGSSLFALGAMTVPLSAMAAEEAATAETLPELKVKATREVPYKATESASSKITQPLIDTPKTIQVVKKEMLREQGAVSLMDALRNTPGITMQLGENGNTSAGDTFQMRGFSAGTSLFIDGLRDTGGVSRDVFNLEQVEIVKGPSGSDTGRGSASGYINLITKQPTVDAFTDLNISYGTADRKRGTLDLNRAIDDTTAFRLNLMAQEGGVPGRDVVKQRGGGIAPSIAFGLGTPNRIILSGQHLHQDDIPHGGIPTIGLKGYYRGSGGTGAAATSDIEAAAITAGRRVDTSNFYGSKDDYSRVNSDIYTLKTEFDISPETTLRNTTRFTRNRIDRVLTSIGNINGGNITTGGTIADASEWTINRTRQRIDQENESLVNQTTINSALTLGGLKHDLAAGLEIMSERQISKGMATATGITPANLYNPNANVSLPIPAYSGTDTDGKSLTAALYALDTISLSESFKVNGGLRVERYKITTAVTGSPVLKDMDTLTSWNLGAVYKPAKNGSVYMALANSLTPPGGSNFTLNASATNQANASFDPQETKTVELGTKWDLFDERLALSAAIYRTENDKQISTDPTTNETAQFGKTRVQGIEFDAVGQITNFWQVKAGVAYMDAKALDQFNTSGVQSTGVRWSPKWSGLVWTSYQLGDFTFGGGVRYMGEQKRLITTDNPSQQTMPEVPSYEIVDLMAAYRVNKSVNIQLNVNNAFDKEYITINNAGNRLVLGDVRAILLSANIKF